MQETRQKIHWNDLRITCKTLPYERKSSIEQNQKNQKTEQFELYKDINLLNT
jgi:hypothetical protein